MSGAPRLMMMPQAEFSSAVAAIEGIIASESGDPAIDPRCVAVMRHHGHPTDRAIVFVHGFTNCPRQFDQLAQLFFERGFNVYVPRLPRHGLRDKLTTELAGLTAGELTACATESVQFAGALGTAVSVVGLSVGATVAAWLAQTQVLDRVVAISPFFSVMRLPALLEPALAGMLELAPNVHLWWDPRVRDRAEPPHAYPRFPTHALAQCLQLGEQIRDSARSAAPRAVRTILVLNAKDPAIDLGAARSIWALWQKHGGAVLEEYTFDNLDVRHDIIEPLTYADAPALVYPVLLRLVSA